MSRSRCWINLSIFQPCKKWMPCCCGTCCRNQETIEAAYMQPPYNYSGDAWHVLLKTGKVIRIKCMLEPWHLAWRMLCSLTSHGIYIMFPWCCCWMFAWVSTARFLLLAESDQTQMLTCIYCVSIYLCKVGKGSPADIINQHMEQKSAHFLKQPPCKQDHAKVHSATHTCVEVLSPSRFEFATAHQHQDILTYHQELWILLHHQQQSAWILVQSLSMYTPSRRFDDQPFISQGFMLRFGAVNPPSA